MALDESDWKTFLGKLDTLNQSVAELNARLEDMDKRMEEQAEMLAQLFDLGGALSEAFAEAKRGPNWGGMLEKGLEAFLKFKKG